MTVRIPSASSALCVKGEPASEDGSVSTDDVFGSQALASLSDMGQLDGHVAKRARLV